MKKYINLILLEGLISVISGILIHKMSFIGRIGVHTAYRQYLIFRSWWKTALLLLSIQLVIIFLLFLCRKISLRTSKIVSFILLIVGIVGLVFTFIDFTTTSHKFMKGSFHSGFYLFWAGWFISCLVFLFENIRIKNSSTNVTISSDEEKDNAEIL